MTNASQNNDPGLQQISESDADQIRALIRADAAAIMDDDLEEWEDVQRPMPVTTRLIDEIKQYREAATSILPRFDTYEYSRGRARVGDVGQSEAHHVDHSVEHEDVAPLSTFAKVALWMLLVSVAWSVGAGLVYGTLWLFKVGQ